MPFAPPKESISYQPFYGKFATTGAVAHRHRRKRQRTKNRPKATLTQKLTGPPKAAPERLARPPAPEESAAGGTGGGLARLSETGGHGCRAEARPTTAFSAGRW